MQSNHIYCISFIFRRRLFILVCLNLENFLILIFLMISSKSYHTRYLINRMSLLIIGSASHITRNIVLELARRNLYKSITISDLLPTYCFHDRFYRLQGALQQQKSSTQVALSKLTRVEELYKQVQQHQHILYVTHDYFSSVTSKTKLMELTADFSKNKEKVVFATPLEYDHFGFENPTQHYLKSQEKVLSVNKNASVVRSDIQDKAETLSYLHQSKSFIEQIFFLVPKSFRPRIICSKTYAETVAQTLSGKQTGKIVNLSGEEGVNYKDVRPNVDITKDDICHHRENISNLVKKYSGLPKVAVSSA